jgi:Fe-S-cluster containining protein
MKILSSNSSWYAAGLAFECIGCGKCCAGPEEGYVWVTSDEIAAIAKHLDVDEDCILSKYIRKVGRRYALVERPGNKDCIFLKPRPQGGKNCEIYPVRPTQCQTWPFWPANLSSPNAWALANLRCGGINRGKILSYDEIEARRKITRT